MCFIYLLSDYHIKIIDVILRVPAWACQIPYLCKINMLEEQAACRSVNVFFPQIWSIVPNFTTRWVVGLLTQQEWVQLLYRCDK